MNSAKLRALRLSLNIPQTDAARAMNLSQAHISRIESGNSDDRTLTNRYHSWLAKQTPRRRNKPGPKARIDITDARGIPLISERQCGMLLPKQWKLLFLTRTAGDTDLAFVYEPQTNDFGIVAFRNRNGLVEMGDIIRFEEAYDGGGPMRGAYKAIAAWCNDTLPERIRRIYA